MEDTKDFYQTSSIHPLNENGDIYSDNTDEATILNDYFTELSSLDDSNANLPADLNIPDFTLNSISLTANEVKSALKLFKLVKPPVLMLSIIEF